MPLGVLAAVRRDSWIDHVARLLSLVGVSAPTFWLAFIMLALFYGGLRIAPGPGRLDVVFLPPPTVTGLYLIDSALAGQWDVFRNAAAHLVLPGIVLAATTLGLITRTTRAAMLDALHQDYVRVARAKGMAEWAIVLRHALPNALIPVVTLGGLAYAVLLSGTVLTETIFSWPGLGRYTFRSAVTLDFPAIMGITFIVAVVYLVINLIVDLSYALLDPRVVRELMAAALVRGGRPRRPRPAAAPRPAALLAGSARRRDRAGLDRDRLISPYVVPHPPDALDLDAAPAAAVGDLLARHRHARPRRLLAPPGRRPDLAVRGLRRGAARRRDRHADRRHRRLCRRQGRGSA